MALALVAVVGALTLLSVALMLWQVNRAGLDRVVTDHLRERYLVTLKSGETFDGLLVDSDGRALVLAQASSVASGRDPILVDGSLILFRADVAYLQRP